MCEIKYLPIDHFIHWLYTFIDILIYLSKLGSMNIVKIVYLV